MASPEIAALSGRGVLSVAGPDAAKFLQGLLTNDVAGLSPGEAAHAALLSPQGKIITDLFALRTPEGFLLDAPAERTSDLLKRLTLYKLRADVTLKDVSSNYRVLALWGDNAASSGETRGTVSFTDPRHPGLGRRILAESVFATDIAAATNGVTRDETAYHAHRIALGVPEGGRDYTFGDAYPHEANFDRLHGVSFTKGCYVGQEIVSRMQHRGTARKRVVRVTGDGPLTPGAPVTAGDVDIGAMGSTDGASGLALLRLDRVEEFAAKDVPLISAGRAVTLAQTV